MLRAESLTLDPQSRALYDRFVPLVADRYHDEIGRPAEHPERLWRPLFVRFYLNLSDAKICQEAQVNLALRSFHRLGHDETPPHPTTLRKFRCHHLDLGCLPTDPR